MRPAFRYLLLAVLVIACMTASAEYRVIGVADGDTVTVLTADKQQIKIRLAGIDAPESRQAFGQRSKQALSDKVFGQTVGVAVETVDRYGRTVADLYLGGRWVNLEMVAEGWAWHYRAYSRDPRLADAELAARRNGLGLWADREPVPPWEFRGGGKTARVQTPAQEQGIEAVYWLNTGSNTRHNSGCTYFKNTKQGRPCSNEEGRACGVCGG